MRGLRLMLAALACTHQLGSAGEAPADPSIGRGWPVAVSGALPVSGGMEGEGQQASWESPPVGISALPVDLFTSKDFYQDERYWSDPRYFRCNSPSTLQAMWGADAMSSRRPDRLIASAKRFLGSLRNRLPSRCHRLALPLQVSAGQFRGTAGGNAEPRWPHPLYPREPAA
jgi:hypothetical protein